jgi:hypothetical protein
VAVVQGMVHVTVPATLPPPCKARVKVVAFTVDGSTASEKVAVTTVVVATFVAPADGEGELTVGAFVSTVNVTEELPAVSLSLVAVTANVYVPSAKDCDPDDPEKLHAPVLLFVKGVLATVTTAVPPEFVMV